MARVDGMSYSELERENAALREKIKILVVESMRQSANASEAREEARRLLGLIQTHKDQTGHNLCWMNDLILWRNALGDHTLKYPHQTVLPEAEFKIGCEAWCGPYYRSRLVCQGKLPIGKPPALPGYDGPED